jgi:antitoxin MazE
MKTTIVTIGNSKGVRIPKLILEESGLGYDVELKVKRGEIKIIAATPKTNFMLDTALATERVLAEDWNRPEEDKAWAKLA